VEVGQREKGQFSKQTEGKREGFATGNRLRGAYMIPYLEGCPQKITVRAQGGKGKCP